MEQLKAKIRFFQKGLQTIYEHGVLRAIPLSLFEIFYEIKFRSKTSEIVLSDELGVDAFTKEHGSIYLPSPYYLAYKAFKHLDINHAGNVFMDFGCGLGRAMFFASQFPFRKIIGVEVSEILCDRASKSLTTYYQRMEKCFPEWQIVHCDAAQFAIPHKVTVFYFGNPFDKMILEPVVQNILASVEEIHRRIFVIYVNPAHADVFLRHGFSVLKSEVYRQDKGYMIMSR